MEIIDRWELEDGSRYYTVKIADDRYVDVKYYLDYFDEWAAYVMDNDDGTQIYTDSTETYDMSRTDQERVLEFVMKEIERDSKTMADEETMELEEKHWELDDFTQKVYWQMYEILRRKQRDDKCLLFQAARAMISAIDEQGNIPPVY